MKKKENDISLIEKKIIDAFSNCGGEKCNYKQIAAKIKIFDREGREIVKKVIHHFVEANILVHTGRGQYKMNSRYLNKETTGKNYLIGRLHVTLSGSTFVIQENGEEDIYIADGNEGNALHQDTVKVLVSPARRKKGYEGQVVEVLERSKKQLVGVIKIKKDVAYFIPDNPAHKRDVLISGEFLKGSKSGDKVVIIIIDWVSGTRNPLGEVIHVLGKTGDNDVEMNSILAEYDFPLTFPEEVEKEAEKLNYPISKEEIKKRKDLRNVPTFTIDPADAKDFDDAISYESLENGLHRVGVHIADVSYYVKPGSLIDQEAYHRGTSVYLVDRTIPMLPEVLSNNLCSLRPNEDKFCYSAIFDMDNHGKVRREWFGRTVIHSDHRFTYEDVQKIIEDGKGNFEQYILPVHHIAQTLRKQRMANNAINFETEEVKFKLDEKGKPVGLYLKVQKEANFLIEEFMLLANKRVAEKIGKKRNRQQEIKTFIYRIHDEPINDKLETFKNFAQKLGFDIKTSSQKALVASFNKMFEEAKERGNYNMLNKLTVRLMAKAVYSTQNIGHYGLAFPYYTHFTSPIRRYPDLIAHRLFDNYLHDAPSVNQTEYETYCKHTSKMEQLAAEAERSSIKYKQAEFLSDKIGEIFEATVTGITKWGVYAELTESKCEGLIPMRQFDDDFYYLDEDNYALVGLHHGNILRFGDKIMIKVLSVDMNKKQMNFGFVKKMDLR